MNCNVLQPSKEPTDTTSNEKISSDISFFLLLDGIIRSLHSKKSAQEGEEVHTAQLPGGQHLHLRQHAVGHKVVLPGLVSFI